MASTPVNCSSSASASCCCFSQLLDETVGAAEAAGGVAGAASRSMGSSNIWARSAGSGGGAANCTVAAVGGAAGGPNGVARVRGGAGVAAFPGSGPEPSEEHEGWQEYAEEVALADEELVGLLSCGFPPHRSANAAQRKPAGFATGTATATVELQGGGEFKRSGQLLEEAAGAIEDAGGAAGVAPKPVGSSNIWARSQGSGGGATAVGAADRAARVGGGAGVAGSGGWTRPGTAEVEVGAGGRHGAEAGAQA
eukprot:scaffold22499_cov42-Phaeocystis_antarctica.AAC.1